ncbi:helix-turn-helix domain-containing protein [Klenkia sp. LSe6-5]|uniref:Helix-turn-helix domain-containing protein n=1 Tax=Klenkia sesuvii TaxID=3103137 RepID=A0ABU8DZT9_9ACTN
MTADSVKSAARAIEILEHFRVSRQPQSMTALAEALGYPVSSATGLLKTLVAGGYLNYDRVARVYFPTTKVTGLGDWIPSSLFGTGEVIHAMDDLHAETGEGIFIGSRNDVHLQYIRTRASTHALRFHTDEGSTRPITRSVAGLVLLASTPPGKLATYVRRANLATTDPTEHTTLADVTDTIEKIQAAGYGYAEDLPFPGGASLAMQLPVTVQGQPVVLGMGGVAERFRREFPRYLDALRRAVASVPAGP